MPFKFKSSASKMPHIMPIPRTLLETVVGGVGAATVERPEPAVLLEHSVVEHDAAQDDHDTPDSADIRQDDSSILRSDAPSATTPTSESPAATSGSEPRAGHPASGSQLAQTAPTQTDTAQPATTQAATAHPADTPETRSETSHPVDAHDDAQPDTDDDAAPSRDSAERGSDTDAGAPAARTGHAGPANQTASDSATAASDTGTAAIARPGPSGAGDVTAEIRGSEIKLDETKTAEVKPADANTAKTEATEARSEADAAEAKVDATKAEDAKAQEDKREEAEREEAKREQARSEAEQDADPAAQSEADLTERTDGDPADVEPGPDAFGPPEDDGTAVSQAVAADVNGPEAGVPHAAEAKGTEAKGTEAELAQPADKAGFATASKQPTLEPASLALAAVPAAVANVATSDGIGSKSGQVSTSPTAHAQPESMADTAFVAPVPAAASAARSVSRDAPADKGIPVRALGSVADTVGIPAVTGLPMSKPAPLTATQDFAGAQFIKDGSLQSQIPVAAEAKARLDATTPHYKSAIDLLSGLLKNAGGTLPATSDPAALENATTAHLAKLRTDIAKGAPKEIGYIAGGLNGALIKYQEEKLKFVEANKQYIAACLPPGVKSADPRVALVDPFQAEAKAKQNLETVKARGGSAAEIAEAKAKFDLVKMPESKDGKIKWLNDDIKDSEHKLLGKLALLKEIEARHATVFKDKMERERTSLKLTIEQHITLEKYKDIMPRELEIAEKEWKGRRQAFSENHKMIEDRGHELEMLQAAKNEILKDIRYQEIKIERAKIYIEAVKNSDSATIDPKDLKASLVKAEANQASAAKDLTKAGVDMAASAKDRAVKHADDMAATKRLDAEAAARAKIDPAFSEKIESSKIKAKQYRDHANDMSGKITKLQGEAKLIAHTKALLADELALAWKAVAKTAGAPWEVWREEHFNEKGLYQPSDFHPEHLLAYREAIAHANHLALRFTALERMEFEKIKDIGTAMREQTWAHKVADQFETEHLHHKLGATAVAKILEDRYNQAFEKAKPLRVALTAAMNELPPLSEALETARAKVKTLSEPLALDNAVKALLLAEKNYKTGFDKVASLTEQLKTVLIEQGEAEAARHKIALPSLTLADAKTKAAGGPEWEKAQKALNDTKSAADAVTKQTGTHADVNAPPVKAALVIDAKNGLLADSYPGRGFALKTLTPEIKADAKDPAKLKALQGKQTEDLRKNAEALVKRAEKLKADFETMKADHSRSIYGMTIDDNRSGTLAYRQEVRIAIDAAVEHAWKQFTAPWREAGFDVPEIRPTSVQTSSLAAMAESKDILNFANNKAVKANFVAFVDADTVQLATAKDTLRGLDDYGAQVKHKAQLEAATEAFKKNILAKSQLDITEAQTKVGEARKAGAESGNAAAAAKLADAQTVLKHREAVHRSLTEAGSPAEFLGKVQVLAAGVGPDPSHTNLKAKLKNGVAHLHELATAVSNSANALSAMQNSGHHTAKNDPRYHAVEAQYNKDQSRYNSIVVEPAAEAKAVLIKAAEAKVAASHHNVDVLKSIVDNNKSVISAKWDAIFHKNLGPSEGEVKEIKAANWTPQALRALLDSKEVTLSGFHTTEPKTLYLIEASTKVRAEIEALYTLVSELSANQARLAQAEAGAKQMQAKLDDVRSLNRPQSILEALDQMTSSTPGSAVLFAKDRAALVTDLANGLKTASAKTSPTMEAGRVSYESASQTVASLTALDQARSAKAITSEAAVKSTQAESAAVEKHGVALTAAAQSAAAYKTTVDRAETALMTAEAGNRTQAAQPAGAADDAVKAIKAPAEDKFRDGLKRGAMAGATVTGDETGVTSKVVKSGLQDVPDEAKAKAASIKGLKDSLLNTGSVTKVIESQLKENAQSSAKAADTMKKALFERVLAGGDINFTKTNFGALTGPVAGSTTGTTFGQVKVDAAAEAYRSSIAAYAAASVAVTAEGGASGSAEMKLWNKLVASAAGSVYANGTVGAEAKASASPMGLAADAMVKATGHVSADGKIGFGDAFSSVGIGGVAAADVSASAKAGLKLGADGLSLKLDAAAEASVRASYFNTIKIGALDIKEEFRGYAMVKAQASAGASLGMVDGALTAGAKAGAWAGASAGIEGTRTIKVAGITWQGTAGITVGTIGAEAGLDVAYKAGKLTIGLNLGAALGPGITVNTALTIDFFELIDKAEQILKSIAVSHADKINIEHAAIRAKYMISGDDRKMFAS